MFGIKKLVRRVVETPNVSVVEGKTIWGDQLWWASCQEEGCQYREPHHWDRALAQHQIEGHWRRNHA